MGRSNRQFVLILPLVVCVTLGGCASSKNLKQPGTFQQAKLAKADKRSAGSRKRRALAEQDNVNARFQPPDIGLGASVGTAWPIASGYVVTNSHVVSDEDDIRLIDIYGRAVGAWVVARDKENDLAVLAVEDSGWLPLALPLAGKGVEVGDEVFTVGYPRIDLFGQVPKRSQGQVDAMIGLDNNPATYQLSLTIRQGNSGGPLMNEQGKVVGVMASMLGAVDANGYIHAIPTTSFAVKARHLREMLAALPVRDSGPGELPLNTDTIEVQEEPIENSVLIVVAD